MKIAKQNLSAICRISLAAVTLLLAAALIWQAVSIYIEGNSAANFQNGVYLHPVYSRALAAEKLRPLLPGACLWVILAIVCAVLPERKPQRRNRSQKPLPRAEAASRQSHLAKPAANTGNREPSRHVFLCLAGLAPAIVVDMKARFRTSGSSGAQSASGGVRALLFLRGILYALALLFLLLGIRNGGVRDVLVKAINICTECIGLG